MRIKSFYYLFLKETKRFLIVWGQTLLGPVITSSLFLFVFLIAFGENNNFYNLTFAEFLIPGLIMMQIAQNAFANSSSSILISKIFGTINDILASPLNSVEITMANILASVTRGFLIAFIIYLTCYITLGYFVKFSILSLFLSLYFIFISSFIMASIGLIAGLWAINFDRLASITNLIFMPLTFLSGTFYSVSKLPTVIHSIIHFNPIFFMIDGFRYSFTGYNDFDVKVEAITLLFLASILYIICIMLLKLGYKIKN